MAQGRATELNCARVEDLAGTQMNQYQRSIHAVFGRPVRASGRGRGDDGDSGQEWLLDMLQKGGKNIINQNDIFGSQRGRKSRGQVLAELGQWMGRAMSRNG